MAETIDESYKQPEKKGTGFTNIQRVMQANVGNRLGTAVGGGVRNVGTQAKTGLKQATQQFQQQSEASKIGTAQDKQLVSGILADPTQQRSAAEKSRFQQLLRGEYKGPQELKDAENLYRQASEAQFLGQALATPGGRVELLKRFARPEAQSYTLGKQIYDNLLLAKAEQDLRAARQATQGIEQKFDTQQQAARGLYGQMQAQAALTGQESQQAVDKSVQDLYAELEATKKAAEEARQKRIEETGKYYAEQKGFTQEDIDRLGLQDLIGMSTANLDLSKYLTPEQDQATILSTAGKQQIEKTKALKDITGALVSGDTQAKLGIFSDVKDADIEAYQKAAGYGFNKEAFRRDYSARKAAAEKVWDNPSDPDTHNFWEAQGRLDVDPNDEGARRNRDLFYGRLKAKYDAIMGPYRLTVLDPLHKANTAVQPGATIAT